MIVLEDVRKSYRVKEGKKIVLDGVNLRLQQGQNMGVLGRNGSGKSTLLRIIGGSEAPDSGRVIRDARVSWPIGFSGGFHGSLTGRENLRFTCRIYGASIPTVTRYVDEFSELGTYLDMPIRTYSTGMRSKLAFGLSLAIGFDYYLIDEVTAVGDAGFKEKCDKAFQERKRTSTLVVVSHNPFTVQRHCDKAAVLHHGKLTVYDDVSEAIRSYKEVCNAQA